MIRSLILLVLCVGPVCTRAGEIAKSMQDPIFAIRYDPSRIVFEPMPSVLPEHCSDLQHRYVKAWTYGRTKTRDAEYFIVSGLMRSYEKGSGRESVPVHSDINGLLVALSADHSRCAVKAVDGFYWTRDEKDPLWNFAESALASDALHRYANAFGGKDTFLKNIRHRERLAPVMREQLEIFEKQSGT